MLNTPISARQREIYDNLMFAVANSKDAAFYTVDQELDGRTYRVFAYRLASYSNFLTPDAGEARGILFEMENGQPIRLAARTPHKFFNLNENPFTIGVDTAPENISLIMDKADGSLISTFLSHDRGLRLKSKTSLGSDQVKMANAFLDRPENALFRARLYQFTLMNKTVNLEYIGRDNRIVIDYPKTDLKVLSVRDNETGEYDFSIYYPDKGPGSELNPWTVAIHPNDFDLKAMEEAQGFEGVVVVLKNGLWFKHKTPWYLALHHTKDSINSRRRLFECVVNEATDDLKAMFFDDPSALQLINEMEALVIPKLNGFIANVDAFHTANKELDRKSYAIKGQQELPREIFSLAMNKYLGKETNFKEWAIKHIELFGVKDEVVEVVE